MQKVKMKPKNKTSPKKIANELGRLDTPAQHKQQPKLRPFLSLDQMMVHMIQFRAMIYAFQSLNENHAFIQSPFFKSWEVGMTYAIFSLFGKLTDRANGASSLKKTWESAYTCFADDSNVNSINAWFDDLDNHNSQQIAYRNKVIAHSENPETCKNEPTHDWTNFSWREFDKNLEYLVKAWGVLSRFSCSSSRNFCASGEEVFHGLNLIFKQIDMKVLLKKYNMFIDKLEPLFCGPKPSP